MDTETETATSLTSFNEKLFDLYENGKHRRYTLLFSVNGGAFAVVEFLGTDGSGPLTTNQIAWGMVVFTAAMSFDIFCFGLKMRRMWRDSLRDKSQRSILGGLFALPGWIVLTVLWLIITIGWLYAGSA